MIITLAARLLILCLQLRLLPSCRISFPLEGVKYFSGLGSVARSIIAKHGYVPPEVLRDMGIMDVIIRTPWEKKSKPKIFFKRDIHQRTKTTPGISGVR